jgi:hypothetical protein
MSDLLTPVTRDRLERLWFNLLTVFETVITSAQEQSTEMLNCCRLFLKDQTVKAQPDQQEQLRVLHGKLTVRLIHAMESADGPPATTLETVRRFLLDNQIAKAGDLKSGLEQLRDLDVPFQ